MRLLFEKKYCSFKICFIIFTLFIFCTLSSVAEKTRDSFSTKSGTVIMFERFDKEYYETLQYLKFADRLISSYLNSSDIKNKYACHIFVLDGKVKGGINIVENPKSVSIYLNKDFRTEKNKFYVIGKMINAMLLAKTGYKPEKIKVSLPSWLIVGIYGKLQLRFTSHSILPVSYFPGLKALSQAEKLPNFRIAVSTSLSPDKDGTAYILYEELCRFLLVELKALSSRSDNPIADMVFLTARKKYSENEVFDSTIASAIIKKYDKIHRQVNKKYHSSIMNSEDKVQKWFEEFAERRLSNAHSPLQTKFFRQRFKRFRKFTYFYKAEGKKPVTMTRDITKLDEIYNKYEMDEGFKEMMNKKFVELDALIFASQPLSRDNVGKIRKILSQFDIVSSVVIRVRLEKILVKLNEDLEKQQKIEDYLRKVEYATVAPGNLYRNELIENKRLNSKFQSGVSKYLNKIEKSFLKD